ncbi:haloacid dehalogenase type II [Bradyrhizobium sp. 2TAF24]|uniref:haloacid dehalogenase type II n=1 Tax=Bradyrhizobium sp. 2TAF24 TaxID=3233011 RepID=UPI003F939D39
MPDRDAATSSAPGVKALLFDVFGTVVDWRGSLIADLSAWAQARGLRGDWGALVDAWRAAYVPSMDEVRRHPERGFVNLDALHRQSLERLVAAQPIEGFTEADFDHVNRGWHRLDPWPDSVSGLTRLKRKFIVSPLSNGNVALLVDMAKHAGLPWDLVLSAEVFQHYKPDPESYLGAARLLGLQPAEVMMVAAHNNDLEAAQDCGLATCFVPRPTEYGPLQKRDFKAEGDWTLVVRDLDDLADRLGC